MIIAAVLFALAAALGIFLAIRVWQGAARPLPVALAHGAFAAAGLVALIIAVTADVPAIALWALGLFAVVALVGFVLFALDRLGRPLPLPAVAAHGAVAVVAFLLLVAGIVGVA